MMTNACLKPRHRRSSEKTPFTDSMQSLFVALCLALPFLNGLQTKSIAVSTARTNELITRLDRVTCPKNVTFSLPPKNSSNYAALCCMKAQMETANNCTSSLKNTVNHILVSLGKMLPEKCSNISCDQNERKTYEDFKKVLKTLMAKIHSEN